MSEFPPKCPCAIVDKSHTPIGAADLAKLGLASVGSRPTNPYLRYSAKAQGRIKATVSSSRMRARIQEQCDAVLFPYGGMFRLNLETERRIQNFQSMTSDHEAGCGVGYGYGT